MLSKIDITEVKSSFRFRVKSFPGDFVNRSLFRAISWMVVFNSFFSFAACELIVHPPCNEPGSLFNTRAVFSNALLKTAALFCPFVKLFLLFSQKKYPAPSLGTRYLSCHLILMTLFRIISEFLTRGIRQSTSQPEPAFIIASGNEAETFESDFEPLPVQEEYVVEIQGEQYGEAFG